MFYRSHIPALPLRRFVDRFWFCSDQPSHLRERIVPSGTVEMVFNLVQDEIRIDDLTHPDHPRQLSGAIVSGTYRRFFVIDPLQHAAILGVHFRPGGAATFLPIPVSDLAGTHIELGTLWGPWAKELRERLCAAKTLTQRFSLLERAFLARLRSPKDQHKAVELALEAFDRTAGTAVVQDVARRLGLSHRRLIGLFGADVGLTPKLYCRILRFQRARDIAGRSNSIDWAATAATCGYFDQSHLIRDFREFTGFSPVTCLKRSEGHLLPNHVQQPG